MEYAPATEQQQGRPSIYAESHILHIDGPYRPATMSFPVAHGNVVMSHYGASLLLCLTSSSWPEVSLCIGRSPDMRLIRLQLGQSPCKPSWDLYHGSCSSQLSNHPNAVHVHIDMVCQYQADDDGSEACCAASCSC